MASYSYRSNVTYTPSPYSELAATNTTSLLESLAAISVGTPAGGLTTGGTSTTTPTNTSTDALTLAVIAIPTAQPGNIITSEYHNALRTAVMLIANRLGIDTTGASGTETYPPHFLLYGAGENQVNWEQTDGVARAGLNGAHGFFPVFLPSGARLQSLRIRGRRTGSVSTFQVRLVRVEIATGAPITLINATSMPVADPFDTTQALSILGIDATALEGFRTVDNSLYTYVLIAEATGLDGTNAVAQITSVTVNFSQS